MNHYSCRCGRQFSGPSGLTRHQRICSGLLRILRPEVVVAVSDNDSSDGMSDTDGETTPYCYECPQDVDFSVTPLVVEDADENAPSIPSSTMDPDW